MKNICVLHPIHSCMYNSSNLNETHNQTTKPNITTQATIVYNQPYISFPNKATIVFACYIITLLCNIRTSHSRLRKI